MKRNVNLMMIVLIGLSVSGNAQQNSSDDMDIPKVEYRGGIYYLELDAETPYRRGFQHGAALKFVINRTLLQFEQWLEDNANIEEPGKMIKDFARTTGHIATVKEQMPDLYEEMKGIADGADVDFDELFVYQSFDELFLFLLKSGSIDFANGHCTTTGIYGRKGLPNYLTHNNDIPTYHVGGVTVLKISYPDSDLVILQQTFAGQIGQNGVNNYGVSVGVNTIADLPITDYGIPVSFHVRRILESRNVEEAVDYLDGSVFGTSMNYMIGDREKVISVETWEESAAVLDIEDNYLAHTNHTLQKDAPVTFEMDASSGGGSYGFTHERLALANKTLEESENYIQFEDLRALKTTRPILVNPGSPTGRTLMCTIIEIPSQGAPVLYTTPDSPNWFEHVKFEF